MGRTTISRTLKKPSSHHHLKPYDARVLAALFTLSRRSHKSKVNRNSLGNYMRKFAKNRPEKHKEPKTWLVTKALEELEAEELVVKESATVLRLSEEVRLGVRKERHAQLGDDSEEDERATQVYFRQVSQDSSKPRLNSTTSTPEPKKRLYKRKSEPKSAAAKRPSTNQQKKRRTTNSGWIQDSESDLTELSDDSDDLERKASLVKSRVPRKKVFAAKGSKSEKELLRLTKADLVEMIQGRGVNRDKENDQEVGTGEDSVHLREELDIVTSGFKELMEQKRRVLARLRRYEDIDEDAEDVLEDQGESDDMGGMGEMILDNEFDEVGPNYAGYRQLDEAASDSETELDLTRRSSFVTPEFDLAELYKGSRSCGFDASYPQLPIVDGKKNSPAPDTSSPKTTPKNQLKRRTHSWNSGHPLSPATSQTAEDGNIFDGADSEGDAYEGERSYQQEPGPSRTSTLPRTPNHYSSSPYKSSSSRQTAPTSDPFDGTSDANEEARLAEVAENLRCREALRSAAIEEHLAGIRDLRAQITDLTTELHHVKSTTATTPTIDFTTATGEDPEVERLRSELEQQVQTTVDLSRNLEELRLNHDVRYKEMKAELQTAHNNAATLEHARADLQIYLAHSREELAVVEQKLDERNEALDVVRTGLSEARDLQLELEDLVEGSDRVQTDQVEQIQAMTDYLTRKESEQEVAEQEFEKERVVARAVKQQLKASELELEREKSSNALLSQQFNDYDRTFTSLSDQISGLAKALGMQIEPVTLMNLSTHLEAINAEKTRIENLGYTLIESINTSLPKDSVAEQDDHDSEGEARAIVGLRRIDAGVQLLLKVIEQQQTRFELTEEKLKESKRFIEKWGEDVTQILRSVCPPGSEEGLLQLTTEEKFLDLLRVVGVVKDEVLRMRQKEEEMSRILVERESALAEKARESSESQDKFKVYRRKSLTAYRALGRELEIEDGDGGVITETA